MDSALPRSVQEASSALFTAVDTFIRKQRNKRTKKSGGELSVDDDRALKQQENAAKHSTRHSSHVLSTLTIKRRALALGLSALEDCTDQCLAALEASSSDLALQFQSILSHYFTNYLRLRDGLVLLTSGECRHPGDSNLACSTKFKSRFGTDSTGRDDGYTTMFSAEGGYSGTGWDEFYDENVGLRTRLVDACLACAGSRPSPCTGFGGNRAKVWDRLCELGAESFESALDAHDNETKTLQSHLERIRQLFVDKTNAILAKVGGENGERGGKLTMVTTDKFERIEIKNALSLGISSLAIERRGDNFVTNDEGGVLPGDWDKITWKRVMALPKESIKFAPQQSKRKANNSASSKRSLSLNSSASAPASASSGITKKKRRIIEESESDSDGDIDTGTKKPSNFDQSKKNTNAPTKAPAALRKNTAGLGLSVKVKALEPCSSTADIGEIKSNLGIDVNALAKGREELEAEQIRSAAAAVAEESDFHTWGDEGVQPNSILVQEDARENMENINSLREEMKCVEKRLKLANEKEPEDMWNARESVRLIKMELGNELLEYHSKFSSTVALNYAEKMFSDSIELVSEQLRDLGATEKQEDKETRISMKRGLLVLIVRAQLNLGLVQIEQGKLNEQLTDSIGVGRRQSKESESKISAAIKQFCRAIEDARAVRNLKPPDFTSSNDNAGAEGSDYVGESRALEVQAMRFQGEALWLVGRRTDGAQKFEQAATATFDHRKEEMASPSESKSTLEMYLAYLVEQYYASTFLIDNAIASAEDAEVEGASSNSNKGDSFIALALKGYDLAANISERISCVAEGEDVLLSFDEIQAANDVLTKSNLLKGRADVEASWKCRKSSTNPRSDGLSLKSHLRETDRENLRRDHLRRMRLSAQPPTSRLTVSDIGVKERLDCNVPSDRRVQRRSQASSAGLGNLQDEPSNFVFDVRNVSHGRTSQKNAFRKWGDELILKTAGSVFPYPVSAPEFPAKS